MTYSLRIVDMAESDRPRERLLSQGVRSLSNAELVAILLGTGQGAGKLSAVATRYDYETVAITQLVALCKSPHLAV